MRKFLGLVALALLFGTNLFAGSGIYKQGNDVVLENDRAVVTLTDEGLLKSFVSKKSGEDIAVHDQTSFIYFPGADGKNIGIKHLELLQNGVLLATMGDGRKISLQAYTNDDFLSLEVLDCIPAINGILTFCDFRLKYDFASEDCFLGAGVAMNLQTNEVYYPTGEGKNVLAKCDSKIAVNGSKIAIVACHKAELRSILKDVFRAIPQGDVLFTESGGPFALDNPLSNGDYLICNNVEPDRMDELVEFYSSLGISQVNFERGYKTFVQGQFNIPKLASLAEFKEKVADPLYDAGIISTMHTYAYYIAPEATEILSNPKWQQQLEFREEYALTADVTEKSAEFPAKVDMSVRSDQGKSVFSRTNYALVDQEIIYYSITENGFVGCRRGQCGTKAVSHKRGAKIKVISGCFALFVPTIGSELFFEVAHRCADAYNEGGYRGIYFDALDGLSYHLNYEGMGDLRWYYGAAFVNEIVRNCKIPPMIEYSTMYPSLWAARGRMGAWDTPSRGYRGWNDLHVAENLKYRDRYYNTTLGWYNFYPTDSKYPGNYSTKYMFYDDVDYVGCKSIVYDQSIVYCGLKEADVEAYPAMKMNLDRYSVYSKLRTSGYFSDKVKEKVKNSSFECQLVKKAGRWRFQQVDYSREKLRDIRLDLLNGNNPFKKQTPMIRIENSYTSIEDDGVALLPFDEGVEITKSKRTVKFVTSLDLSERLAVKVKVLGNGADSNDAICIRLESAGIPLPGYSDHIIRLDYEGWREFVLTDLDNAEFRDLTFKGMPDSYYKLYRQYTDYSKVTDVSVYLSGDCNGVKMGDVKAVKMNSYSFSNPSVTVGGKTISFDCDLASGEYLEYDPVTKKAAAYDQAGNSRYVAVSGAMGFRVPSGDFEAELSGTSDIENAPIEATLTFGFSGQIIK